MSNSRPYTVLGDAMPANPPADGREITKVSELLTPEVKKIRSEFNVGADPLVMENSRAQENDPTPQESPD
jgi:hypothetical protein